MGIFSFINTAYITVFYPFMQDTFMENLQIKSILHKYLQRPLTKRFFY